MKAEIFLGKLILNSVQNNAGTFWGDNTVKGWQTRAKTNSAIGRVNGDGNMILSRLNFLHDPDFIDMVVKKFENSGQNAAGNSKSPA
ncbi:MAG: hypothetical protein K6T29_05095 [Peptococcaceae bacterium]|nr:hypothetical protein [Peptococcaceae bacterium]